MDIPAMRKIGMNGSFIPENDIWDIFAGSGGSLMKMLNALVFREFLRVIVVSSSNKLNPISVSNAIRGASSISSFSPLKTIASSLLKLFKANMIAFVVTKIKT